MCNDRACVYILHVSSKLINDTRNHLTANTVIQKSEIVIKNVSFLQVNLWNGGGIDCLSQRCLFSEKENDFFWNTGIWQSAYQPGHRR